MSAVNATVGNWYEVDRAGLAKLLERKGRAYVILELLQNAWDEAQSQVALSVDPDGAGGYRIEVEDDSAEGFKFIEHAYTLFAESTKKGDAEKRGRFNLGEKLVLAVCDEASILTTKGHVTFGPEGRSFTDKERRELGTIFSALIKLDLKDRDRLEELVRNLIPPLNLDTYFNGQLLPKRSPAHTVKVSLPTEIADESGVLRNLWRVTPVHLYATDGEPGWIYEMGIPVVETGDTWHCDIQQKVPLNMDRDNVTPSYLKRLRTTLVNNLYQEFSSEIASDDWVRSVMAFIDPTAATKVIELRFGHKVVAYDPSDPEANKIAMSQGYHVLGGRTFTKAEWNTVRAAGIQSAGVVTPSPTKLLNDALSGERVLEEIPASKWTPGMNKLALHLDAVTYRLLGRPIEAKFVSAVSLPAIAWFTHGNDSVTFNLVHLGHRWFECPVSEAQDALILHELAHDRVSDHLDHAFSDEVARLGAKLARVYGEIEVPK